MDYIENTLPNGLRVITVPLPNLASATLTVWVKVGSRYESAKLAGISHFLEHMTFKGSQKRPTAKEISETVDALGADYNAGTSREWTNFYIKARSELIGKAFDVLSDMVLNPLLKTEDIEREKGVIVEEIAMQEDTPGEHIGDLFVETMFKGNSLARDIAGTKKSVKGLTQKDFVRYRDTHYGSDSIIITVAGGVEAKSVEELSQEFFGNLKETKRELPEKFTDLQKSPKVHLQYKKSEQAHFILGFLGFPKNHPERFAESVMGTILGRGMSSRLFTEVREKRGLAYAVNSSSSRFTDTGIIATYAGVDVKRIEEAISVVLEQTYGLASAKYPITQIELGKAKEYIKGRTALALEDTTVVNDFFGQRALFSERIETPEDIFAAIDKVTIEDVLRVANTLFDKNKLSLAVIGPYKDQKVFEKLVK